MEMWRKEVGLERVDVLSRMSSETISESVLDRSALEARCDDARVVLMVSGGMYLECLRWSTVGSPTLTSGQGWR